MTLHDAIEQAYTAGLLAGYRARLREEAAGLPPLGERLRAGVQADPAMRAALEPEAEGRERPAGPQGPKMAQVGGVELSSVRSGRPSTGADLSAPQQAWLRRVLDETQTSNGTGMGEGNGA
jgi:hypothetical protein